LSSARIHFKGFDNYLGESASCSALHKSHLPAERAIVWLHKAVGLSGTPRSLRSPSCFAKANPSTAKAVSLYWLNKGDYSLRSSAYYPSRENCLNQDLRD